MFVCAHPAIFIIICLVFRLVGDLTVSEQQRKWAKRAVTDSFSDPSNKFLSQRTSSYGIFISSCAE
jgi:hypothetical protein